VLEHQHRVLVLLEHVRWPVTTPVHVVQVRLPPAHVALIKTPGGRCVAWAPSICAGRPARSRTRRWAPVADLGLRRPPGPSLLGPPGQALGPRHRAGDLGPTALDRCPGRSATFGRVKKPPQRAKGPGGSFGHRASAGLPVGDRCLSGGGQAAGTGRERVCRWVVQAEVDAIATA
jgi:hypothetical protein